MVALLEEGAPEVVELGERGGLLAQTHLGLEGLLDGAVEALDDAAPLADVGLALAEIDAGLYAGEVEAVRLVARPMIDVELPRDAGREAQVTQADAHAHQVLGHEVARLGDVARAVVDEGAELGAAHLAGVGAHVGPGVKVANHEGEHGREAEPHMALVADGVQHAAAGALLVEVSVERGASQRTGRDLAGAHQDVDEGRRRAVRTLVAQRDGPVDRGGRDRARGAAILARTAHETVELVALVRPDPSLQGAHRDPHEVA